MSPSSKAKQLLSQMNQRRPNDEQNVDTEIEQKMGIIDSMSAGTQTKPDPENHPGRGNVQTSEGKDPSRSDNELSLVNHTAPVDAAHPTEAPSNTEAEDVDETDNLDDPGGYTNLPDLLERFDYLYNDYFKGAMDDDRRVFDDYIPKSFIIEKSMAAQIDAFAKKMNKKKGFHKRLVNTGLKIALDLYKLQLEQQEQTQPKRR